MSNILEILYTWHNETRHMGLLFIIVGVFSIGEQNKWISKVMGKIMAEDGEYHFLTQTTLKLPFIFF